MQDGKRSREGMLELLGLNYNISRAEGQYVTIESKHGKSRQVLDLIAGYGSALFGHSYKPFTDVLLEHIRSKMPVFTQLSARKQSRELAVALSDIAFLETGIRYEVCLLNTGT